MCCRVRGGCTKSEKICDYIIVALSETEKLESLLVRPKRPSEDTKIRVYSKKRSQNANTSDILKKLVFIL